MKKYFHELTKEEFSELVATKMTWAECAELYPQPTWCSYPEAVCGEMGCWSLMDHLIHSPKSCYGCDLFIPANIFERVARRWYIIRNSIKRYIRRNG